MENEVLNSLKKNLEKTSIIASSSFFEVKNSLWLGIFCEIIGNIIEKLYTNNIKTDIIQLNEILDEETKTISKFLVLQHKLMSLKLKSDEVKKVIDLDKIPSLHYLINKIEHMELLSNTQQEIISDLQNKISKYIYSLNLKLLKWLEKISESQIHNEHKNILIDLIKSYKRIPEFSNAKISQSD